MTSINVVYLGHKTFKADNVAGTGIVWHGHGDIQPVPLTAVAKLMEHPAVWGVADEARLAPPALSPAQQSLVAAAAQVGMEAVRPTAPLPEAEPQRETEKIVFVLLAGSNHADEVFHVAPGIVVPRDDAITHTFRGTGLSPADWNALTSDGRTAYVNDYLQYRVDRQDAVDARAKFAAGLQTLKVPDAPTPEPAASTVPPAAEGAATSSKAAEKGAAGQTKAKGAGKAGA